jgi:hypothetical protein
MRRAALTTTVALTLAALAAGCGRAPAADPAAGATAVTSLAASPVAEVTPAASAAPSAAGCAMSGTATGGSGASRDVMTAWLSCDTAKLKDLLTDEAYTQLKAVGVPKLDGHWAFTACDGAMGSNYCTFRNKLGSDVVIRVRNEPGPHPVTEFKMDATVYHDNAEKYAREFLDAFVNHNKPRMVALSSQSIVDGIVVDAPPAGYTLTLTPEPKWVYSAKFTSTGEYWVVTVHGPLGKAHAITAFNNAG